jgi:hypothetical protein
MIGFMQIVVCHRLYINAHFIQWHGDNVELVYDDDSINIATTDPMYWELEDFECFSGRLWEGGFIRINNEGQQPI